jgi:hypothetical protein
VTATITIRSFSSAIVITYLSHVVKQRVLHPSRHHRSRLFEPDSSGVFFVTILTNHLAEM